MVKKKKTALLGCGKRLWSCVSSTAPCLGDKRPNQTVIRQSFTEAIGKKLHQLMSIMNHSIQGSVLLNYITLIICIYEEKTYISLC